jgi:hypothetical protein
MVRDNRDGWGDFDSLSDCDGNYWRGGPEWKGKFVERFVLSVRTVQKVLDRGSEVVVGEEVECALKFNFALVVASEETSDFSVASFVLYSPKRPRTLVIVVVLSKAKERKKGRKGKSFGSGLKERGLICRGRSENERG